MRQKQVSYSKYGYIFSIPFILAFLFFMLYPLFYTLVIGFTDLRGIVPKEWSILDDPFENFKLILNNNSFRVSLGNTFKIWTINFIPQISLALLLTAWFTRRRNKMRGQGAFKVLFYMPNIITAATIAIMFSVLFRFPDGPINQLMISWGLREEPFNFLANKSASQYIVAGIQFWMWYGYTMLILISGVLGLNPEMYEAAEVDGASNVQQFFRITLPNLRTIILYILVTSMVGGLNMFDIPRLFNNGMPDLATTTTSLFIYQQAFAGSYMFNRAAAASMILFLIIAVLAIIIFYLLRDKDAAKAKKLERKLEKQRKAAALAVAADGEGRA